MKSLINNIIGCILKSIHLSDKLHSLKSICKQTVLKSAKYFAKSYKFTKNSLLNCLKTIVELSIHQSNIKKQLKLGIYFSCFIVVMLTFSLLTSNGFIALGMQNDNTKINSISQIPKNASNTNVTSDTKSQESTQSEHITQIQEQLKAKSDKQAAINTSTISAPVLKNTSVVEAPKKNEPIKTAPSTKTIKAKKSTKTINTSTANYANDPFKYPQCVWYVWARVKAATGIVLQFNNNFNRNAKNWLNIVKQTNGIQIVRDKNAIQPNSIAVFSVGGRGDGHVVFIENVVKSSSGKIKTVTISESNWGASKSPSTKTLSWDEFVSRSNGSLIGYINL